MCILWFMDQVHEPQMGKLREMWFGGHQRDPSRVPNKGSKVDTWLGVVQFTLGKSDSIIPSAKANQHSTLS